MRPTTVILPLMLLLGSCTDPKSGDDQRDAVMVPDLGPTCVEGTSVSCPEQRGSCAGSVQTCTDGKLGACSKVAQEHDTCDRGNDDNCNGVPNEGCQCINGTSTPCANQNGVCAGSFSRCNGGVLGPCSVMPDNTWHKAAAANGSWDWNCDGTVEKQYAVNGAWPNCRYTSNPKDLNCCGPSCIPPPGAAAVVCGNSPNVCGADSYCGSLILFSPAFCSSCGAPWPPPNSDTQGCK